MRHIVYYASLDYYLERFKYWIIKATVYLRTKESEAESMQFALVS